MDEAEPSGVTIGAAGPSADGRDKAPYKLFISYRRHDSTDFVEHIRSWFAWRFEHVFMDFDIPGGAKFEDTIHQEITTCDAMIAIIGPDWVAPTETASPTTGDWVYREIEQALAAGKTLVPIYIKDARELDMAKLPDSIYGMSHYNFIRLVPGRRFTADIEREMESIIDGLAKRVPLGRVIEKLDANSPAAGLALGYYVNFVKPTVSQLAAPDASVTDMSTQRRLVAEELRRVRLQIVIPPRIALVKDDALKRLGSALGKVSMVIPERPQPMVLPGERHENGFRLVDLPRAIGVLENWLRRQRAKKPFDPTRVEEEALRLEQRELGDFESVLRWWIDDQANDPAFRERVEVVRFTSEPAKLGWLAAAWPELAEGDTGTA